MPSVFHVLEGDRHALSTNNGQPTFNSAFPCNATRRMSFREHGKFPIMKYKIEDG